MQNKNNYSAEVFGVKAKASNETIGDYLKGKDSHESLFENFSASNIPKHIDKALTLTDKNL